MQSFADAVAGGGGHGIIHGHDGQGAHRVAALSHHVHLRNLFGKRANGQGDAERAFPKLGGFFPEPRRATILGLIVALYAIVGLI
jgi:hypothetical protein